MPIRAETRARALALQLLYAWEQAGGRPEGPGALLVGVLEVAHPKREAIGRALEMAEGVVRGQARLDATLEHASEHWRLERLSVVDRNILRLAVFELELGEAPPKVVIDEALRLAHWFGGEKSPAFVNGILDRVAREHGRL